MLWYCSSGGDFRPKQLLITVLDLGSQILWALDFIPGRGNAIVQKDFKN